MNYIWCHSLFLWAAPLWRRSDGRNGVETSPQYDFCGRRRYGAGLMAGTASRRLRSEISVDGAVMAPV